MTSSLRNKTTTTTAADDVTLPGDDVNSDVRMTITLEGSKFLANGHPILTDVPPNIRTFNKDYHINMAGSGCFVGFDAGEPRSLHVATIGKLRGRKFMSLFRFKLWWTTHWVGTRGNDVESETQMMVLDKSHSGRPYVLLLPLLEGPFRASIQPGPRDDDRVDICVESGSTRVTGSRFRSCLYIRVGSDPYVLVKEAMEVVRAHMGSFRLLREKTPPGIVDKFGWSTWDAFYKKVNPRGVREGVRALSEGGCPPGMVLIDDGWQSVSQEE
ncbi:Glycosyl hydrolase [Parasponia andersonii]|uniref:Glycosyl hydrolase n=1 Tax=Parasponia andersonii TaxID=3476 RepID=A0A2P5DG27_PARAD|nr:Glycosyl hydrolase [Parasponia andersonii]